MTYSNERRLLQCAVALAGIVPVGAGLAGMLAGAGMLGEGASLPLDSHVRYLSGLLLGIGLAFWAAIPAIERHGPRFRLLTFLVALGGVARLAALATQGFAGWPMAAALLMELAVTPLICAWQWRIEGRAR